MNMVRFDPFTVMRDFDRLFGDSSLPRNKWMPRVDVKDQEDSLMVRTEVPGVDAESIEVTVEGGTLTISGSRNFSDEETADNYHRKEIYEGSFERTILLPDGVDPTAVSATSKDGILEITIPKQPEVLPHKITVEVQR